MKVAVIQTNYIPWKGYFDLINDADVFVYYDEVQYTKNDWRNRNQIYAKNGLHWLTIPIAKRSVTRKISEVRIDDHRWQKKHLASIISAYGRAPYFKEIRELIEDVYIYRKWDSLSELNRYLIERISNQLGCATRFVDSKELVLKGDRIERLIDISRQMNATEYITGPAAWAYLEGSEQLFAESNVDLTLKDYSGYPEYRQGRQPFEHAVSVLDLVVNVGFDQAPWYIWAWRDSKNPSDAR